MKRSGIFAAVLAAVCVALTLLGGCDLTRKLQGAEVNFRKKVENAEELSFDLFLTVTDEGGTSSIDMACYMKGEEYAYVFGDPDNSGVQYRKLYADGKLYEFMAKTVLTAKTGTYYIEEGVDVSADENVLYWVRKNIMLASYAALITAGKKETDGDKTVYRYDFTYGGNDYSLWYDDENMTRITAVFRSTDDDGTVYTETYDAKFSNYLFAGVSAEPFKRPAELNGAYIESPVSFETWMSIMDKFGGKAGKWLE